VQQAELAHHHTTRAQVCCQQLGQHLCVLGGGGMEQQAHVVSGLLTERLRRSRKRRGRAKHELSPRPTSTSASTASPMLSLIASHQPSSLPASSPQSSAAHLRCNVCARQPTRHRVSAAWRGAAVWWSWWWGEAFLQPRLLLCA
jgi:hypothetical protein